MWLFTNSGFVSIVADRDTKSNLLVRGRLEGDIQSMFPRAKVIKTPHADYLFRASIPRQLVAKTIAKRINDVQYDNFKDSVSDPDLHESYLEVWATMRRMQEAQNQDSLYPQSGYDHSIT